MGFRFRRSIRVLPLLRLNVGKRGASVSVGGRGAHVTLGHGQVRETVGLPGIGLSYTHVDKTARKDSRNGAPGLTNRPQARPLSLWAAEAIIPAFLAMAAIAVGLARKR
jgi:Protein of unknown function (DUF4236)